MALSDTKLRTLAPRNRPWQLADHDGLVMKFFPPDEKSGVSATALTTNRNRSRWANTQLSHLQKRGSGVKSAAHWLPMASIPRRKSRKKSLNRKTQRQSKHSPNAG